MKVRSRLNVVLLICIIVLLVSLPLTAYSIYEDPYNNLLENDKQVVSDFVELWIKDMYHNDGTKVDKISQVLNENEIVTGYIIDFAKNNTDNGYMVLDKRMPDKVVDFALCSKSITDKIKENVDEIKPNTKLNKLYFDGLDYYAKIKINNYWSLINCNKVISKFDSWKEKLLNSNIVKADLISNYVLSANSIPTGTEKVLSRADTFVPVTTDDFNSNNHCGPTAAVNLIKLAEHRAQGGICNKNSDQKLFAMVCNAMNFVPKDGSLNSQIFKGLKGVAKNLNTKVVVDEYWFDLWSDFVRDIDAGKSIYLGLNTKDDGHALIVVGYRICENAKYLRVIDNWNYRTNRYVLFNKSSYTSFQGASVLFKNIN